MKKLNTYQFYSLATKIHPLTGLIATDTEFGKIFIPIYNAASALRPYIGEKGIFPPSSRHAAIDLVRLLDDTGLKDFGKAKFDMKKPIISWQISSIIAKARDLETVFATACFINRFGLTSGTYA